MSARIGYASPLSPACRRDATKAGASPRTPQSLGLFGVRRLAAALPTDTTRKTPAYPFVPQGKKAAADNSRVCPIYCLRPILSISCMVLSSNFSAAAATFSSKWDTRDVPGMGSITVERHSSQDSASCDGLTFRSEERRVGEE